MLRDFFKDEIVLGLNWLNNIMQKMVHLIKLQVCSCLCLDMPADICADMCVEVCV